MEPTVIGVDPHKRSHTAVVLDADEEIASQRCVTAERQQAQRLLSWAEAWPQRCWEIENTSGLGRLLAQQLVAHGETVVDVPASLPARARKLSGHSARKTDEAMRARRSSPPAIIGGCTVSMPRISPWRRKRSSSAAARWSTSGRRTICQLHQVLAELVPGGAPTHLSTDKASRLLRRVRTPGVVNGERRQIARELLADWRWFNRRVATVERRLSQLLAAHGTSLTGLHETDTCFSRLRRIGWQLPSTVRVSVGFGHRPFCS